MVVSGYCHNCEMVVGIKANEADEGIGVVLKLVGVKEDDYELIIKYFVCPYCGKTQTVQIDTEQTKRTFESGLNCLRKAKQTKSKKKQFKYKQMFKDSEYLLALQRRKLAQAFDGHTFVCSDGSTITYTDHEVEL